MLLTTGQGSGYKPFQCVPMMASAHMLSHTHGSILPSPIQRGYQSVWRYDDWPLRHPVLPLYQCVEVLACDACLRDGTTAKVHEL